MSNTGSAQAQPDESGTEPSFFAWMTSNAKRVSILLLAGVLAACVGYGAGRWQGRAALKAAEEEAIARQAFLEKALGDKDAALSKANGSVSRLEARRLIDLAIASLDKQNFGDARLQLQSAAELMTASGAVSAELRALVLAIEQTKVSAMDPLETQVAALQEIETAFDALMPPPGIQHSGALSPGAD